MFKIKNDLFVTLGGMCKKKKNPKNSLQRTCSFFFDHQDQKQQV